jgi:menaquinol-cytochrome c reductase iron-sulfur subunit
MGGEVSGQIRSALNSTRRSFLGKLTALIGASIAAVVSVAAGRFTFYPAFRREREERQWQLVGPLDEIPEREPTKRSIVVSQDGGWGNFNSQRLVWIIRDGSKVEIFSAACPHLGCTVNAAPSGFICPCHGSAWSQDGRRLGGPTQRGLDILEYRVEGGVLQVKYQYFKPGIAERQAIS